jgi:maltooligosyltrehalose trehalohydrolase
MFVSPPEKNEHFASRAEIPDTSRMRFGAWRENGLAVFHIWAPSVEQLSIEVENGPPISMIPLPGGWFEYQADLPFGTRYRYRLSDGRAVPDPASRYQDGGVHGLSVLIPPDDYAWECADWRGRAWEETVLYELHVGLLGGYAGVERQLPNLAKLGVTSIELMPLADFPGLRSWGYDGVLQFAPATAYGSPNELKRLIDRAHVLGMSVLLDVVFNHFGPDGNYLPTYAKEFFREHIQTPWGAAIDFDRSEVRSFFIDCALQWITEFRFDGLRLDAVHAIKSRDFLFELNRTLRAATGPDRHLHLIVENDQNDADLLPAFDAQWNDDFHHAFHVLLTGETTTYYASFSPQPAQHIARALGKGFAFQGEVPAARKSPKGKPSGHLPPSCFVNYLQNHDQIGNRMFGERLTGLVDAELLRAASALLILSPQIPLLFMGEEYGSRTSFHYFIDHEPGLAHAIREGRKQDFAYRDEQGSLHLLDPNDPETFEASKPSPSPEGNIWFDHYARLIEVRRESIVPHLAECRNASARSIGERCIRASWQLGPDFQLTVLANFDGRPVSTSRAEGRTIFELGDAFADEGAIVLAPRSFRAILTEKSVAT